MQVSVLHHVRLSERPVDREFKSHRPHVLKDSFLFVVFFSGWVSSVFVVSKKVWGGLCGLFKDHYGISAVNILYPAHFRKPEPSQTFRKTVGCILSGGVYG